VPTKTFVSSMAFVVGSVAVVRDLDGGDGRQARERRPARRVRERDGERLVPFRERVLVDEDVDGLRGLARREGEVA
jgi:hypothetical protein